MYNLLKHLLFHIRSILSIIQPISALNPNIESVQKFDWVKSLVRRKYNGQKKSSLYNYEYDSHNSSFTIVKAVGLPRREVLIWRAPTKKPQERM